MKASHGVGAFFMGILGVYVGIVILQTVNNRLVTVPGLASGF